MTRLHQVIAIERGVVADTDKQLAQIGQILKIGGDKDPLTGISRTYESRQGADGDQLPPEQRKVQTTIAELLKIMREQLTRLFDLKFTREFANCSARADVIVDGVPMIRDAPAGYLLFLENEITSLIAKVIDKLPVLNPAEEWRNDDPALPAGVWRTAAKQTERTKKVPQVQVLYEATPQHPAQVRPYETDVIEGYWTQIRFSGQLPVREVQAMRARAVKLLEAVRYAREHANELEVTNRMAGEAVLGYVFGDGAQTAGNGG
jgi:hypothetical protein